MRFFVAAGLALILLTLIAPVHAEERQEGSPKDFGGDYLSLEGILNAVLESRPDIRAFESKLEATYAEADYAGAMSDPVLGFGTNNVIGALAGASDAMSMREIMVSQRVPWPGKRKLRSEVLSISTKAVEASRRLRELELMDAAVFAYVDLWLAAGVQRLLEQQKVALSALLELSDTYFAVSSGRLSDSLRAESALVRLEEPLLQSKAREHSARSVLASLIGGDVEDLGGTPSLPGVCYQELSRELLELLIDNHPLIEDLEAGVYSRQTQAELAALGRFPDLDIRVAYIQRDVGNDSVGLQVMGPITFFGRERRALEQQSARAEARSLRAAAAAKRLDLKAAAQAEYAEIERSEGVVPLYKEHLIPLAVKQAEALIVAYESGQEDFSEVLHAHLQIYEYELRLLRAKAERVLAYSRLNRTLGQRLGPFSVQTCEINAQSAGIYKNYLSDRVSTDLLPDLNDPQQKEKP